MKKIYIWCLLIVILAACGGASPIPITETVARTQVLAATASPTQTRQPGETSTASPPPTATLAPQAWQSLPVIPLGVSQHMIEVYQRGLARGHDPDRFSKIGDCQNITPYFLAAFSDSSKYRLGAQYAYLQPTIDRFSSSWSRKSMATHAGFNAATVLNPFWTLVSRPGECEQGETPAACEIRLYNPSIVVISMEEAWSGDLEKYDRYMRMLVEYVLSQDVVPILATRAELSDSPVSINGFVVQISYEYDIPLWNFGAATESLPDHGLSEDGFHLTPGTVEGNYYFDDPARMQLGWTWRNLTALQAIDAVSLALAARP